MEKIVMFYLDKYNFFSDTDLLMFTFLDPSLKAFGEFEANEANELQVKAVERVKEAWASLEEIRENSRPEVDLQPITPIAKRPVLQLFNFRAPIESHPNRTARQMLHSEIVEYRNEKPIQIDPLVYWSNSSRGLLKRVALAVLSCQPTSTPS